MEYFEKYAVSNPWGRKLIPDNLTPEVQAVYEENVNIPAYIRKFDYS